MANHTHPHITQPPPGLPEKVVKTQSAAGCGRTETRYLLAHLDEINEAELGPMKCTITPPHMTATTGATLDLAELYLCHETLIWECQGGTSEEIGAFSMDSFHLQQLFLWLKVINSTQAEISRHCRERGRCSLTEGPMRTP